ncbi:hypothetical protein X777_00164 [Ooceraea biroi]|uniref:Uncharacterized protein n=1 Tax=Ooceraea biroi TaxID=2015173 RepID=A0A026VRS3_OOCBI|nr:hypothetical protein X777_00164 [Ooceraea biroi]
MTTPVCDRTRLLEWLLTAPWQKLATRLPIADMCASSIDLVLSSRCRQTVKTDQKRALQSHEGTRRLAYVSHRDVCSTDLPEICHASLIFKVDLSASRKNERIERTSGATSARASHVTYVQDVFNFLKKRLHDIFQEEGSSDEVYITLMKIALLARLLSALKLLGVVTVENIVDCPLIDVMKSHLTSSFEVLTKIDPNRSKYMYLLNVTRALSELYGTTYDADIAKMIVSASTLNMLQSVFDVLNFDDSRNCDYYKEHNTFQVRRTCE